MRNSTTPNSWQTNYPFNQSDKLFYPEDQLRRGWVRPGEVREISQSPIKVFTVYVDGGVLAFLASDPRKTFKASTDASAVFGLLQQEKVIAVEEIGK